VVGALYIILDVPKYGFLCYHWWVIYWAIIGQIFPVLPLVRYFLWYH